MEPKVLLVQPLDPHAGESEKTVSHADTSDDERNYLGLKLVERYLEQEGVETEILDLDRLYREAEFAERSRFYERIVEEIADRDPTHVGMTAMSNYMVNAVITAKRLKKQLPEATVFMGGTAAYTGCRRCYRELQRDRFRGQGRGGESYTGSRRLPQGG